MSIRNPVKSKLSVAASLPLICHILTTLVLYLAGEVRSGITGAMKAEAPPTIANANADFFSICQSRKDHAGVAYTFKKRQVVSFKH